MENTKKTGENPEGLSSCRLIAIILAALIGEMMLFFLFFPYPAGRAMIAIMLQPLIINVLLMTPLESRCLHFPPRDAPEISPECKKIVRIFKIGMGKIHGFGQRFLNLLSRHRIICVTVLSALTMIGCNFWFWKKWTPLFLHPISVYIPVVFGVGFFLLMALEIWCRHLLKELKDPDGHYGSILKNLCSQMTFHKFLLLASAVTAAMPMLKLPSVYRQLYYILCAYYGLETLGCILFYSIRLSKQELNFHPDLRVIVLHRKKGDLNLLGYLEENTGITMRSLWSIAFIKKLLPYALLTAAVILWLCTGIVQIAPNQNGALYRLGKLRDESLEPGLHMILPWPFDSVDVYDTKSLKEITVGYTTNQEKGDNLWTENHGGDESKLLLGGGNELVSINLRIEFRISDLCQYLRCSNSPESLLESAAYETVTARTISTNLESLLDLDRIAFSKSFEEELTRRISQYDTGLQIVDVVVESIHPPIEVAEVYQKIISAGIDAQRILLDAQAVAATAVEQAKTEYDTAVNSAKAESYASIAAADASVKEFMASVQAEQDYGGDYRYYKYLDALQKAYGGSTLVIVGEGIDSSHLYLGKIPS